MPARSLRATSSHGARVARHVRQVERIQDELARRVDAGSPGFLVMATEAVTVEQLSVSTGRRCEGRRRLRRRRRV